MLAYQGSNPLGNVVHLICGPETDLFTDVNGASIMDITPLINNMDKNKPVFISLTRCRIEPITAQMMTASGMKVQSNMPYGKCNHDCDNCSQEEDGDSSTKSKDKEANKAVPFALRKGKCDYCGNEGSLLPFTGVNVCPVCAQIELGRSKNKTSKHADSK